MNIETLSQLIRENLVSVITLPIIAALIGWITNYIAVKMIFRPRVPRRFLGFTIHGLIPRRQKELALSIGETVQRDLVSHKDVQKVLQSPEVEGEIRALVEEQIEKFMHKMLGENPMIAMFIQGSMVAKIKETLVKQMTDVAPSFLDRTMQHVENKLDFKQVVQEKIESFDLSKLEDIIYRISREELKTIEILGGVLGFFVGLAQVAIMLITKY